MNKQDVNPWTILSSSEKYDNPWITVTEHQILNPKGGEGIYGTVHFKNIAIGIIVLDEDHNTWLVGQYRFPLNTYSWEIPEGGGLLAVDPLESAKRELKEETGIVAKSFKEIMQLDLSNSATDEHAHIFIATGLAFEEAEPEDSEDLQVKKIHLNEVFKMVLNGEITDAISVSTIYKIKYLYDLNLLPI